MKKTLHNAFTMLELVFVIVVAGILAAVMIPRTESTNVQEAAIKLVSDIRYTQHLAMVDDKFDSTVANWYINRWQIRFNGNQYSVVSDNNTTFARDPLNKGENLSVNLGADYGVTITPSGLDCLNQTIISFDHLGRPMLGSLNVGSAYANVNQLIQNNDCDIIIRDASNADNNATISIEQETGYARID